MFHRRHKYNKNRNDFNRSKLQIIEKMLHWILVIIMLFQQLKTTAAVKFKGDNCFTKNQAGVCKEWGECPIIKTLIESGEYTNREVVSCGFGIREELICCPIRTETKNGNNDGDRSGDQTAKTAATDAPVKDFWLDLLQNSTSSTTAAPDFWLDLLATTTTTSTTPKPLIIGNQKLNESSEFFDFNALLGGNKQQRHQTIATQNRPNINANNQASFIGNGNGRGNNRNTGPVNINQWNFGQSPSNFPNDPSNTAPPQFMDNANEHLAWGQQNNAARGPMNGQSNFHRGFNRGRGPHNHFNNGRGPHNNIGGIPSIWAKEVQHQGFAFPPNNIGPNNFFGEPNQFSNQRPLNIGNIIEGQNPRETQQPAVAFPTANSVILNNVFGEQNQFSSGHVNNLPVQQSNPAALNTANTPTGIVQNNSDNNNISKNNDKGIDDLISHIFTTSESEQNDPDFNKPQHPVFNNPPSLNGPQRVVWLTAPQNNANNKQKVDFVQNPTLNHQSESRNPQVPGQFEIAPVAASLINGNDLEEVPSTNFIAQPVVVHTWPPQPFNPIQVVHDNLANSGLEIVKAQETAVLQPTTLIHPPPQVVLIQSQPPQIIYQQQSFVDQTESAAKGPRSALTLPQSNTTPLINVQSPPLKVLDPFKPFEFRPSQAEENTFSGDNNSLSTNSPKQPDTKPSTDRPAVRACRRIEKNLPGSLSPHILGGTPAELGEFPHMAAIGYSRIGGDDRPPYDIRCGGTLVDKRFVLTAAHCVSERENVPSIVRLGVVNFTDVNQMNAAVELRIKQTYIHDEYRTRLTYNDIAILELERDVEYSEYIYPVCLYTDLKDPDSDIKLWVTGWGTVNTTTRSFSDILLKAPLHTAPLERCNKSFTEYGLNRRIPEGIIRTQFCAEDKDQIKDACQGDSGGPLNLIVDESYKNYRLVGVVSSGFGCASSTPGLYTRVAAFLDFIEKIVWPNGGD